MSTAFSINAASYFSRREKELKLAGAAYVVLLMLSHWQLPSIHVWFIAAFFSIAMNFTYLIEAVSIEKSIRAEGLVSGVLILASVLGLLVSPVFVIVAIFGHGCWDVAKHFGAGVAFFSWYTWPCFLVDTAYSAVLLIYWVSVA